MIEEEEKEREEEKEEEKFFKTHKIMKEEENENEGEEEKDESKMQKYVDYKFKHYYFSFFDIMIDPLTAALVLFSTKNHLNKYF